MTRSMDRFRADYKYAKRALDMVYGDDLEYLPLATGALAEITQKAVEAKASAEKKKALDAATREVVEAQAAVQSADLKENDKGGPLHKAAQQRLIDAQTKLLRIDPSKALVTLPEQKKPDHLKQEAWYKSPVFWGIGGVAVLGIGYLMLRKK